MNEIQMLMDETTERMEHALTHLDHELAHIRAGKASPRMIEGVLVDYYGSMTPLPQVANISTPDADHCHSTLGEEDDPHH